MMEFTKAMTGSQLFKQGLLGLAEKQYRKEGRNKIWIAEKFGNYCAKIGWYHSAVMYYRKGGTFKFKAHIIGLVARIKKKGWLETARQIAILGDLEEYAGSLNN